MSPAHPLDVSVFIQDGSRNGFQTGRYEMWFNRGKVSYKVVSKEYEKVSTPNQVRTWSYPTPKSPTTRTGGREWDFDRVGPGLESHYHRDPLYGPPRVGGQGRGGGRGLVQQTPLAYG